MINPSLSIPLKSIDPELPIPQYAHEGDAGLDLYSAIDIELQPFQRALVPCGFALAIPQGYAGFVMPRSGLAIKHGISLVNTPGLIDSNYRGELKVILINHDPQIPFSIKRGDRIAQLVIMKVADVSFAVSDSLPETSRGEGGFGSSGV